MRLKPVTMLHKCADCAYWQPALNYFGQPTGRGGCPFARAHNRKGDKLRECANFIIPPGRQVVGSINQEVKELDALIHFWKDNLTEHRLLMSPSAVYLVEQTIVNLEKMKQVREVEDGSKGKALE